MDRARPGAVVAILAIVACGDHPMQPEYDPQLDPADFVVAVTNSFFPLPPGTTQHDRGETSRGIETIVTEVPSDTRTILGITATIVHDQVFLDGASDRAHPGRAGGRQRAGRADGYHRSLTARPFLLS